jgi:tRNA A-37 threonylcarbamoyl transferase component Bud32
LVDVDPVATTVVASSAGKAFSPGDVVADRYRVEAPLGRGAMGVVYLVEHVHMRKRFALKVLDHEWATSTPEAFARFEREAIAAGSIADPHVAHATDFGQLADGSSFLVLEYVEGTTLRTVLNRGALKVRRALTIARGIVSAVNAAHAIGIVHRDLKPENIMLVDRDGDPDFVKVLDFGIARIEEPRSSPVTSNVLTREGVLMGTPLYMSPEQVAGERVDGRADLYAIGVILFEMLAGECPFRGETVSVLRQHVLQEAPPLPGSVARAAGEEVAVIVRRLLAKTPDARFASAAELGAALDHCMAAPGPDPKRASRAGSVPDKPSAMHVLTMRLTRSVLSWPGKMRGHIEAYRKRRRLREALAWPRTVASRVRTWRRRRPLDTVRASPAALANRLRLALARPRKEMTPRRLGFALAVGIAVGLVLLGTGLLGRHADPPAMAAPAASVSVRRTGAASASSELRPAPRSSARAPASGR